MAEKPPNWDQAGMLVMKEIDRFDKIMDEHDKRLRFLELKIVAGAVLGGAASRGIEAVAGQVYPGMLMGWLKMALSIFTG